MTTKSQVTLIFEFSTTRCICACHKKTAEGQEETVCRRLSAENMSDESFQQQINW